MPLRPRVAGLWLYAEYATNYLTDHYFNDIVQSAFKVRNAVKSKFGIEIDFKAKCPLFGKKNKAKKA